MAISSMAIYLMIGSGILISYAEWVPWPSEVLSKSLNLIIRMLSTGALHNSNEAWIESLFLGHDFDYPSHWVLLLGNSGITLMWLRHEREQLKLKFQELMTKEAIAKGVEIGMKKAKEN